ncbi:MAG: cytochrome ubiquinol oxidase subunit I [Deltaproteobacteria bacterium]|nr:cytochrome ubiquinol oxidase subunit I [Deltaproteobacteria bacterium]
MTPLNAARAQMEVSLAFHMVFAALGIGMPLLMLLAEGLWLKTHKPAYRAIARSWSKATAVLFAVGAVSGTALSFELGLLWPGFMRFAGAVVGPAFALEGYAFFIEAIFVGLYLYGWDRMPARMHFLCGIPVAISGLLSGIFVVAVNAWMQTPAAFVVVAGRAEPTHALAPFMAPSWGAMALHSTLSCYAATGFAVAGVYAYGQLKGRRDDYHRTGLRIALSVGAIAAILQLVSGHHSAQSVAHTQPLKLAAMEALYHSERGAPLLVGGWPDRDARVVRYGIALPKMLSFVAFNDPNALVRGLESFDRDEWPNERATHIAFQLMVGAGMSMIAVSLAWLLDRLRGRKTGKDEPPWLLRAVFLAGPLGMLALEAGWFVSELGRQPWVVRGLLRTRDAVTPAEGITASFFVFSVLYVLLAAVLVTVLRGLAVQRREALAREVSA